LGWLPSEALRENVNHIPIAHKGRTSMFTALFGGGRQQKAKPTAEELLSFARAHNALHSAGKLKTPVKAK
jgi:hypothetical protein